MSQNIILQPYLLQRKTTRGWHNCSALGTPLLADLVDKYAKMSRRKHPFKLLHKLHNRLRYVCEVSTETTKHGRNRQPQNSLNSTSWLCPWGYRNENDFPG